MSDDAQMPDFQPDTENPDTDEGEGLTEVE